MLWCIYIFTPSEHHYLNEYDTYILDTSDSQGYPNINTQSYLVVVVTYAHIIKNYESDVLIQRRKKVLKRELEKWFLKCRIALLCTYLNKSYMHGCIYIVLDCVCAMVFTRESFSIVITIIYAFFFLSVLCYLYLRMYVSSAFLSMALLHMDDFYTLYFVI